MNHLKSAHKSHSKTHRDQILKLIRWKNRSVNKKTSSNTKSLKLSIHIKDFLNIQKNYPKCLWKTMKMKSLNSNIVNYSLISAFNKKMIILPLLNKKTKVRDFISNSLKEIILKILWIILIKTSDSIKKKKIYRDIKLRMISNGILSQKFYFVSKIESQEWLLFWRKSVFKFKRVSFRI